MKANQCLWNNCFQSFNSFKALAYHVSDAHRVPNDWTMLTKMHYCYEHDEWCQSDQQLTQRIAHEHLAHKHLAHKHLAHKHLAHMNNFCGLIRLAGVVVVAAHCLFCLGDVSLPIATRFTQLHDVFTLHKHMKEHLVRKKDPLSVCPLYPRWKDSLDSDHALWEHAQPVHGTPPFAACRETSKRKIVDHGTNGDDLSAEDVSEGGTNPLKHQRLCGTQASGGGS